MIPFCSIFFGIVGGTFSAMAIGFGVVMAMGAPNVTKLDALHGAWFILAAAIIGGSFGAAIGSVGDSFVSLLVRTTRNPLDKKERKLK